MTQIEITIDTNKPIADTVSSIKTASGVTVTTSGTTQVIVVFENPVAALTFNTTAQIRWKSISVTYIA